jgi:hypothetical protein
MSVGTAAYLGLAVLGWGGFAAFFSHPALIALTVYSAGGALRIWPVFVLGNRFSGLVAIQPGHTLVTSGIYRVIRHPSYLGLLINSLGWSLGFRSTVWPVAYSTPYPAAPRTYPCRRKVAARNVRHRVRCLLRPDFTTDTGALLTSIPIGRLRRLKSRLLPGSSSL